MSLDVVDSLCWMVMFAFLHEWRHLVNDYGVIVVDWDGGVCCNYSIALLHHWLLPINCHFLQL